MSELVEVTRTVKDNGVMLIFLWSGKYIRMAAALKAERHSEADEVEASMRRRWEKKCSKIY